MWLSRLSTPRRRFRRRGECSNSPGLGQRASVPPHVLLEILGRSSPGECFPARFPNPPPPASATCQFAVVSLAQRGSREAPRRGECPPPFRGCPHPKSRARGDSEVAVPINRPNLMTQVASAKACSPPLW